MKTARPGVTLVELLIGMFVTTLILYGLVGFFMGQSEVSGEGESQRTARTSVRTAGNVLTAEARKGVAGASIVDATATQLTLRVPFAMGVVCTSDGSGTVASVFPNFLMSMQPDNPVAAIAPEFRGYFYMDSTTGQYVLKPESPVSEGATGACTGAGVRVFSAEGGRVVDLAGAGALPPATPVLLYRVVRYRFEAGDDGLRLVRSVERSDGSWSDPQTLVEPFDDAEFRLIDDPADAAKPAASFGGVYDAVLGIEVELTGRGHRPRRTGGRADAPLTMAVYFQN